MKKCLLLFCCLLSITTLLTAQILSEGEARKELQKRGIDEDEFRQRMMEKGFDPDNMDVSQISDFESTMEEVVKEMEAEVIEVARIEQDSIPDSLKTEQIIEDIKKEGETEISEQSADRIRRAEANGIPLEEAIANELAEMKNKELPEAQIYGQQVFRNQSIALYTPSEDIRPPDTYVLGPGDKISVLIWGKSQENASFTISKAGDIQPDRMPIISLKGLTYEQARALIRSRYSEYYNFRKEDFAVTIDYSRTITVNIMGEAIKSGSYNVPATNTAFNALVASGGPSDIGSVRNIKLMHSDGSSQQLDVYDFLLDPSIVKDYFLQNNDFIFIPIADIKVSIDGAIRRPYMYEMLPGEGLKKLVLFAGGLTENAYKNNIQVTRFVNDEEVIIDVNYNALVTGSSDFKLEKGDRVFVKNIENAKRYNELPNVSTHIVNGLHHQLLNCFKAKICLTVGEAFIVTARKAHVSLDLVYKIFWHLVWHKKLPVDYFSPLESHNYLFTGEVKSWNW